jgi:hypothetical protein
MHGLARWGLHCPLGFGTSKNRMSKFLAALIVSLGCLTTANADTASSASCIPLLQFLGLCSKPSHPGPTAAPEIDPATTFSGLMLLAGGLAVLRGRRSRPSLRADPVQASRDEKPGV